MNSGEERTILHVDMDAFFAAIEQRDRPELRDKPVIVGPTPDQRGVVSTCSYEARTFGIHSAMPSRTAARLCPSALFLPVNMPLYKAVSKQIMEVFHRFTPLVQPLSVDEAFLDVTGSRHLFGDGPSIAHQIKKSIRTEVGLSCSVGVAPNLFLAKLASDMNKPDGLTVAPFSEPLIRKFLEPLPLKRMWGAGPKTRAILEHNGLFTIGDLQKADPDRLARLVGPAAASAFLLLAHGIDERVVTTGQEEKSLSSETTFAEDLHDPSLVESALMDLTDQVAARLRKTGRYASTAKIKLRWSDFSSISRQRKLDPPCCDDQTLRETALALLQNEPLIRPVRLIGFGVDGLLSEASSPQLDLFAQPDTAQAQKREALSRAVDEIRTRYGKESIARGSGMRLQGVPSPRKRPLSAGTPSALTDGTDDPPRP